MVSRRFFYHSSLFCVLALLMFAERVWTQTTARADQIVHDRISATQQRIDSAATRHATDGELGVLWRQLGNEYQEEYDIQRAEEAYTRSLKLLHNPSDRGRYAATLDDLGSLYLASERWKESESCRGKALAIYEELGNQAGIARVEVGLAITFVHLHRFAESEAEAAKALKSMQEQKEPDKGDLVAGLIVSSYAKCFQDRCNEGLVAAGQAMGLASARYRKDSLEVISALMAIGFEEWKAGDEAAGEKAMHDALELARQSTNLPHAVLVDAQLRILAGYTKYLKAAHQKVKAKEMENEMARLKQDQTPFCKDCTVNAVALSMRQGKN
jgi:hypothetical protein